MPYRIAVAGTDARTLLSALTISTATSENHKENTKGFVVRGTPGMKVFSETMNWPVEFINTEDNSAKAYAGAVSDALKNNVIDCVVPMPEKLLFEGFIDELEDDVAEKAIGLKKDGAFIEGDKIECKRLCEDYNIPVAPQWFEVDAKDYGEVLEKTLNLIEKFGGAVLKYPYSASGKGARVVMNTWEIEEVYSRLISDYKDNYKSLRKEKWPLLIESRMSGVEISFTALLDKFGNYQILPTAMDYPERFQGPASKTNPITGGMGSISPHPMESDELIRMAGKTIFEPFIRALKDKNLLRPCILYPGCFVSFDKNMKPKNIRMCEMNIRPGEPEFQPVVRRLRNLGHLIKACVEGNLDKVKPEVRDNQIALCSCLAAGPGGEVGRNGYPWSSVRGEELQIDYKYFNKKKIQVVPSAVDYDHQKKHFTSDGGRIAFLNMNAAFNDNKSEVASLLRQKMLSSLENDKIKVVRAEDKGNRLQLREDIGLQYGLAERIFDLQ